MEGVKVPISAQPQKFFDQFRAFIRLDGKSYATENTYVYWFGNIFSTIKKNTRRPWVFLS